MQTATSWARNKTPRLTKTGRSRISRANCPRWPGLTGPVHFGSKLVHFRADIAGFHLIYRRIAFDKTVGRHFAGQRRTTREADLSTQQTGAQAPSRLSRPSRDRRRPQGSGRPPRAWPQASERLSGRTRDPFPMRRLNHGPVEAARGFLAAAKGPRMARAAFRGAEPRPRRRAARCASALPLPKKVGTAVERNRVRRRLREL
jgi:hypothetical protein